MGKKRSQENKVRVRLESFVDQLDNELVGILMNESDRGSVLVASAFIEEAFEHFLRKKLRENCNDPSEVEWLLTAKPMAPIGSFHSRITTASVLGLIEPGFRDALLEFKTLRNSFAHRHPNKPNPQLTLDSMVKVIDCLGLEHDRQVLAESIQKSIEEVLARSENQFLKMLDEKEPRAVEILGKQANAELEKNTRRYGLICFVHIAMATLQVSHQEKSIDH